MRYALLIPILSIMLGGCSAVQNQCGQVLPVYVLEREPALTEDISLNSLDAAIRYLAIRESFLGDNSPNSHDVVHDRWDRFIAVRFEDDVEDTAVYVAYLEDRQELFQYIAKASELTRFQDYGYEPAFYEGTRDKADPRRDLYRTLRTISISLGDDAQRNWINGDRAKALERIDTVFSVSLQMQHAPTYQTMDSIMSMAIAGVGLRRISLMIERGNPSAEDRERMLQSLQLLDGPDPLNAIGARRIMICSYHKWLETQLVKPEGTLELWTFIARYLSANAFVGELFRNAVSNADIGLPDPEPEMTEQQMIDVIVAELEEISIEMIRDQYEASLPLLEDMLRELHSDTPDLNLIKAIQDQTMDDETGVSDILGISVTHTLLRKLRRFLDERDSLVDQLKSMQE